MSIVQELDGAEEDIRKAVNTVIEAEQNNEEIIDSGSGKNSHFEFEFGEHSPDEVFVYVERLHENNGFEVMFWVDESYFVDKGERPNIQDGGAKLKEFVESVSEFVVDEIDTNVTSSPEYYTDASPSVVFTDVYYLD